MKPKKLLISLFLTLFLSCEFESDPGVVTYTFFELEDKITISTNDNVQTIHNYNTNLKMSFDANLLKNQDLKFEPTKLNEHLILITNEHNIITWEFEGVNDGFVFVGAGYH